MGRGMSEKEEGADEGDGRGRSEVGRSKKGGREERDGKERGQEEERRGLGRRAERDRKGGGGVIKEE